MENCFLPPTKPLRPPLLLRSIAIVPIIVLEILTLESLDAFSLRLGLLGETRRGFHAFPALVGLLHDGASTQHEGGNRFLLLLPRYIHQRPVLCLQLNYVLEKGKPVGSFAQGTEGRKAPCLCKAFGPWSHCVRSFIPPFFFHISERQSLINLHTGGFKS